MSKWLKKERRRQEKARGTHIQGLEKNHPPVHLTIFYWMLCDATPSPSEFFSLGCWGVKKSFVGWQRFCDYGKDHCKTFSKLVHINDFHSL